MRARARRAAGWQARVRSSGEFFLFGDAAAA
jgi:hypothetical protein